MIVHPSLVHMIDGQPLASSVAIAGQAGVTHPALYRMILKHHSRITRFGTIRFESRLSTARGGGGKAVQFAWLNEAQATFLLTMLRNTESVLDLKEELVRQFFRMRDEIERLRMTLYQERLAIEQRDNVSKVKGTFGSRLMLERRYELHEIEAQRAELERRMQGRLFVDPDDESTPSTH